MAIFTFSSEHYDRLQEMVLKGSFGHILKGVMFLKWKLVNQRNKIYHKTYVLLGVQPNLSFQNQPQDYCSRLGQNRDKYVWSGEHKREIKTQATSWELNKFVMYVDSMVII